jgi:uncharacterized membrane protein YphA (DoxX/SURF4 family)
MRPRSATSESGSLRRLGVTIASLLRVALREPDATVRSDRTATRVAIVSGVIFVGAGLVKFVFHHWELHAFREFGLPWPSALEIFAGVLECVGGVLLVARLAVVPVAVLLSATMVVAIGASGIGHGDVIPSLTLAPALLLAMLFLIVRALQRRSPTLASKRRA